MAKFRVGFIGCGYIARTHAVALAGLRDRVEVVACCDVVRAVAQSFADEFTAGTARVFTDHREMIEGAGLDIAYICLPPFAHTDQVELAAGWGCHVFVEKPIALSMKVARPMVAAVEQAGVKSQVGFQLRFGAAVEEAKRQLDSGEAGRAGLMIGQYLDNSPHAPWWRDRNRSGGQVVEQIIHLYDLARYFLGDAVNVYAGMGNVFHRDVADYTVEDIAAAIIHFDDGALASISSTNGALPDQRLYTWDLIARNRTMRFAGPNRAVFHHTDETPPPACEMDSQRDMKLAQALDLLEAIERDGVTRTPIAEGAKSLQLVLAARESAETGQPVAL